MTHGAPAMTDAPGTVVALDGENGEYAIVQLRAVGCGHCDEPGGCGGKNLARMFCATPPSVRLPNPCGARPGDRVLVVSAAGAVRHGANLAYGMPLVGLLAGALAGSILGGESGALAGAGAGIFLAWRILRRRGRREVFRLDLAEEEAE